MSPPAVELLPWHDEVDLLGVRVRAYFFDPTEVDARSGFAERQLPILQGATAQPLSPEGQRETYQIGGLRAQPDAVLAHGSGLLCLTYKGGDGRWLDAQQWRGQWRVDVMLQCIASAMAVAGQRQLPTAALWRGVNLLCQFDPSPPVLECLATNIAAAQQYWNQPASISPAQLAAFCEPRLRVLPGLAAAPVAIAAL
jgi:hypothetical protein